MGGGWGGGVGKGSLHDCHKVILQQQIFVEHADRCAWLNGSKQHISLNYVIFRTMISEITVNGGNGVDSYVSEGQWLSKCRVSLAERKKERKKEGEKSMFDSVWFSRKTAVLKGAAIYSGIILHVDNDSEA